MAATSVHAQAIHPNPIFEGMEKRLEIDFRLGPNSPAQGLRAIPRETLDELMTLAACCIVSNRSNAAIDAYVLSESSLFITETKWVLKTCGTTRLLNAIPRLMEVTQSLGLTPRRCKYSRATFLFPQLQVRILCFYQQVWGMAWAIGPVLLCGQASPARLKASERSVTRRACSHLAELHPPF